MNGINEKHKNHMSKSNNSFLEAAGKKQDLTMIQKIKLNFCEYNFLLAIYLRNRTAMNEMNEKHKNHMSKSNNCVSEALGKKTTRLDYMKFI